jgi:hypothetical protein
VFFATVVGALAAALDAAWFDVAASVFFVVIAISTLGRLPALEQLMKADAEP